MVHQSFAHFVMRSRGLVLLEILHVIVFRKSGNGKDIYVLIIRLEKGFSPVKSGPCSRVLRRSVSQDCFVGHKGKTEGFETNPKVQKHDSKAWFGKNTSHNWLGRRDTWQGNYENKTKYDTWLEV